MSTNKFYQCQSNTRLYNPFPGKTSAEVSKELNLNLGQSILNPDNKVLLWIVRFFDVLLLEWWEQGAMKFWDVLPASWKRQFVFTFWAIYFPLHKWLVGNRSGIHPDGSLEYHAIVTLAWGARFFRMTVRRLRFCMEQIRFGTIEPIAAKQYDIDERVAGVDNLDLSDVPERFQSQRTVKGLFLHRQSVYQPTEWTIFWVFGGAFLGGDVHGSAAVADYVSKAVNMDVFLPSFRTPPESDMYDTIWDVCLAYHWLCQIRDPSKIVIAGISSGGAHSMILLQLLAAKNTPGRSPFPSFATPLLTTLPAGAILFCPFVDLTDPTGSFVDFSKHDILVTQRILETCMSYVNTHGPNREKYSPIHNSFAGLPPLCVVTGDHDPVIDMNVKLINQARREGVSVTVGSWKYTSHAFPFFCDFLPEGKEAIEFACRWIQQLRDGQIS